MLKEVAHQMSDDFIVADAAYSYFIFENNCS